jgi:hypothetical protein
MRGALQQAQAQQLSSHCRRRLIVGWVLPSCTAAADRLPAHDAHKGLHQFQPVDAGTARACSCAEYINLQSSHLP